MLCTGRRYVSGASSLAAAPKDLDRRSRVEGQPSVGMTRRAMGKNASALTLSQSERRKREDDAVCDERNVVHGGVEPDGESDIVGRVAVGG